MSLIRVRFAPSPTGELHIGGARTALFNWLFARKNGGAFILRIDDTDKERSREEFWSGILEAMHWLGLDWDEGPEKGGDYGPYFQSQRYHLYEREIKRLIDAGKAYYCYCSVEDLKKGREEARRKGLPYVYPGTCRNISSSERVEGVNPVVRFRSPDSGETVVKDEIRGEVSFDNRGLDDSIILKSSGAPTYNFASVVDDWEMKISHVIRAEEHLSNTPRQQLFAEALGYSLPVYAHVPMILAPDRSKLSKRHGATSVQEFREKGFLPEALVNYLALLGWSPPGEEEILPLKKITEYFSLNRVVKTAAIYDTKKITWINGHYIREGDPEIITEKAMPFLQNKELIPGQPSNEDIKKAEKIFSAMNDRVKTLQEFADASDYLFKDEFYYDEAAVKKLFSKNDAAENIKLLMEKMKALTTFNREELEKLFKYIFEKHDISPGRLNKPVRLALSGKTMGPELLDIIMIIGRDKTLKRLGNALDIINKTN